MPKGTRDQLPPLQHLVHGKKLPILVLDERWYKLFPGGVKPEEVKTLEKKCNELLKEQGKLVNEIKDLRRGKKKLMDAIVSGMNEAENDRKKEKQKKLLIETNEKSYIIAQKVGYTDSNYFSYVFKRHFGVAPSKYRTEHAEEAGT